MLRSQKRIIRSKFDSEFVHVSLSRITRKLIVSLTMYLITNHLLVIVDYLNTFKNQIKLNIEFQEAIASIFSYITR